MAKKPMKSKPRKGAKKAGKKAPRRRVPRRVRNVQDFASLSVSRSYANPSSPDGLFRANTLFSLMNTTLSQFDRAVQVAKSYQHYRIKYISVKFLPQYDTFAFPLTGQTTAMGKPHLYWLIDKSGALPTNITAEAMKQMGAKPIALDEKPIVVGWRPSVLTADMTAGAPANAVQPSQYKLTPWLTTSDTAVGTPWNANDVDHLGLYFYVDSTSFNAITLNYKIDVEVQFEFKKPLWPAINSQIHAISAQPAQINDSPDGIVGGSDGI